MSSLTTKVTKSTIGPFPTDWAPGPECSALGKNSHGLVGFDFHTSCHPPNFVPARTAVYSPGTACPSGYTAPASCTRHAPKADAHHQTVTCCPVRGDLELTCVDDPEKIAGPFRQMFCTWTAGEHQTVLSVTATSHKSTTTEAITYSGGEGIYAYGLRMVNANREIPSTSTATQAASTATSTNSAASSGSDDGNLSTGAVVATAISVPAVLTALFLAFFFWYRRRKQGTIISSPRSSQQWEKHRGHSCANSYDMKSAIGNDARSEATYEARDSQQELFSEMPSREPAAEELHGTKGLRPQELETPKVISELPASTHPRLQKERQWSFQVGDDSNWI